jgi:hypothetical protein
MRIYTVFRYELDLCGSGEGPVIGTSETSFVVKGTEFLDHLSGCQF